jgi:RNA polymerase sigma-70 factor (ECF subfamily)
MIMTMIRSLPDGYRTVFNLFVFEKKSHKEIAEMLGIAENSSASQFHRAKTMLAQKIKEYTMSKTAHYE